MPKLPSDVIKVKKYLEKAVEDDLREIALLLINDKNPEIASMWISLEKRNSNPPDELWVYAFLESAKNSYDIPAFHLMSKLDRNDLTSALKSLDSISKKIVSSGLDMNLVASDGKIFNGYYFYEDFGLKNRYLINQSGNKKMLISSCLVAISERLRQRIEEEPQEGKVGRNAHAIRFIRSLADCLQWAYGETLLSVIATATNEIFQTTYSDSDISKMLSR